jgi:hypothetical protein
MDRLRTLLDGRPASWRGGRDERFYLANRAYLDSIGRTMCRPLLPRGLSERISRSATIEQVMAHRPVL